MSLRLWARDRSVMFISARARVDAVILGMRVIVRMGRLVGVVSWIGGDG